METVFTTIAERIGIPGAFAAFLLIYFTTTFTRRFDSLISAVNQNTTEQGKIKEQLIAQTILLNQLVGTKFGEWTTQTHDESGQK